MGQNPTCSLPSATEVGVHPQLASFGEVGRPVNGVKPYLSDPPVAVRAEVGVRLHLASAGLRAMDTSEPAVDGTDATRTSRDECRKLEGGVIRKP